MRARSTILALAAGLSMLVSSAAWSQQPPPANVLSISTSPDEAARKSIQGFIDPQMKLIATGKPDQVQEGRKALASLLRKPDCSLVFYRTFLQLATPGIEQVLKSGDAFRATNALLVVRQIRCSEALSMMLEQSSVSTQPDARVRIAASAMIGVMVRGGAVPPAEIDGVSRRIRESVDAETNALAAGQLVESLGSVAGYAEASKLPAQVRGALDELLKATGSVLQRAQKRENADFSMAVLRGLVMIRDTLVKMSTEQQKEFGKPLGPLLKQVDTLPDEGTGADAQAVTGDIRASKQTLPGLAKLVGIDWKKPESAKK